MMEPGGSRIRLEPVRSWRIHLGAHKTATTHLQETLAAARRPLAARGLDYIPNPDIRGAKLAPTLWRRRPIARVPILGPSRMREAIEAVLEPLRIGPTNVVLSEENIIGVPHQIFEAPTYPQLTTSIARLASLALQAELVLFLSIRPYDTLLPSAYAEALKHAPPPEDGFEAVRARAMAAPPSWFDIVRRIRAAAPAAPLRIWRQEDYRANSRAIMEAFCGAELGELPEISDPSWTRSPSPEGIAAAEAVPGDSVAQRAPAPGGGDLRGVQRQGPVPSVHRGGAAAAAGGLRGGFSSGSPRPTPTCC